MSDTPRPQRFFNRHEVAAIVAMHAHQECNKLIVIVVAEKDAGVRRIYRYAGVF